MSLWRIPDPDIDRDGDSRLLPGHAMQASRKHSGPAELIPLSGNQPFNVFSAFLSFDLKFTLNCLFACFKFFKICELPVFSARRSVWGNASLMGVNPALKALSMACVVLVCIRRVQNVCVETHRRSEEHTSEL